MDWLTVICFGAIFLLGVPHGALDPSIAQHSLNLQGRPVKSVFYLLYLVLAVVSFVVWFYLPVVSLGVFLLVSCLHFGREREFDTSYGGLPFGCLVVGLPVLVNFDAVISIFSVITLKSAFDPGLNVITYGLALLGVWGFTLCMRDVLTRRRVALGTELVLLALCAYWVTPLVYFTLYFCLMHSAKHLIFELRYLPPQHRKSSVANAAVVMGATAILAIWGYQSSEILERPADRLLFTMFAGLAALTYPHMALMEVVRFRRKRFGAAHEGVNAQARA